MAMKAWLGGLGAVALVAALGLAALVPPAMPPAGEAAPAVMPPLPLPLPMAPPAMAARVVARPVAARAVLAPVSTTELDRLVAAARQGDRRAAYAAYQALSACAVPEAPQACRGLPASLVQERLRFLADAVQAGIAAAQIDFYMEGPDALQALGGDALQAWREQALGGLKAAAGQCEPFAMGLLATLYDAGELTPRDPARALAYAVAEGQLRRRPASDEALRDRLAEPVDDATLAAARQQGLSLAGACR